MKRLVYIWLVAWVLWGCQKEEAYFDVLVPADGLTFSPVEGGAVMHYRLPADEKVYSIRVRYQDGFGKDMIRTGSYACDSLLITGFNEARKGVKAYVTLCDRNDVESEALEVTFDTRDSGPVAFINNLEVVPGWGNGFVLSYDLEEDLKGMAHLFYVGEDPNTKLPDTLLFKSFVPKKGNTVIRDTFKQQRDSYDFVVRVEDFRGNMVKKGYGKTLCLWR